MILQKQFCKNCAAVPTAHEGIGDFPNKPGKQNDRSPISGKRSFFAFGGHMPSLPVTAKRGLCAHMYCLPVSGTGAV